MRTADPALTDPAEQLDLLCRLRSGQEIRVEFDNNRRISTLKVSELLHKCQVSSEAGEHNLQTIAGRKTGYTTWGGYNRYQFVAQRHFESARELLERLATDGYITSLELLRADDGGD